MKYLKQYGIENLKPGDVIILDNIIVVFLYYKNKMRHLVRFKKLYDMFHGEVCNLNNYNGWYSFKSTRYNYNIDSIIKLDEETLPKEFIETRDKIMENPNLQKKLLKWSLDK